MKPYTLEWWFEIYDKVQGGVDAIYDKVKENPSIIFNNQNADYINKKLQLRDWVRQRIVKEYGGNNDDNN